MKKTSKPNKPNYAIIQKWINSRAFENKPDTDQVLMDIYKNEPDLGLTELLNKFEIICEREKITFSSSKDRHHAFAVFTFGVQETGRRNYTKKKLYKDFIRKMIKDEKISRYKIVKDYLESDKGKDVDSSEANIVNAFSSFLETHKASIMRDYDLSEIQFYKIFFPKLHKRYFPKQS
jgi:hypothetical protein